MRNVKIYSLCFIILILLLFIPSIQQIAKTMEKIWPASIAFYWIILTIIAIVLGFRATRG